LKDLESFFEFDKGDQRWYAKTNLKCITVFLKDTLK